MTSETQNLKNSPLHRKHEEFGARFVPFGGWNMPVNYPEGIIAEHIQTRTKAALFDICHMGEFLVSGTDAASTLDSILPRSASEQKISSCRYNFLLNERGTVIDDIIVYRLDQNEFFIVVNAATKEKDANWIKQHIKGDCRFEDLTDRTAKLDLQGPASDKVMEKLGLQISALPPYYRFIRTKLLGVEVLLSRTGYTGELGYELYFDVNEVEQIWDAILSVDEVKPAGLGARDTLRIESAYPLYGHELNEDTTPVEAGFGKLLNLSDGRDFIGKKALIEKAPSKKIAGIILEGRRAAREGAEVFFKDKKIGYVSSGSFAPSLQKAVAIAFIDAGFQVEQSMPVEIFFQKNTFKGCFSEMPFYKNGTAKK